MEKCPPYSAIFSRVSGLMPACPACLPACLVGLPAGGLGRGCLSELRDRWAWLRNP